MRRLICLLAVLLNACSTPYEPVSLHGAASMRVEVEVYKGPLSTPVAGQVGELVGVLSETIRTMSDWQFKAERVVARDCRGAAAENHAAGRVQDAAKANGSAESRLGKQLGVAHDRRDWEAVSRVEADALWAKADQASRVATEAANRPNGPDYAKRRQEAYAAYVKAEQKARLASEMAARDAVDARAAEASVRQAQAGARRADDGQRWNEEAHQSARVGAELWTTCQVLRDTIASSRQITSAACYLIKSPTLGVTLGRAVYLPMSLCSNTQDRDYSGSMLFLGRSDSYGDTYGQLYTRQFAAELSRCDMDGAVTGASGKQISDNRTVVAGMLECQGAVIALAFSNLSSIMRSTAFRAVDVNLRRVPANDEARGLIIEFGSIASDYGNQIQSRITVLQKQIGKGIEAKTLPVSDYLRDAGRPDFIQLYDWLDAAADSRGVRSIDYAQSPQRMDVQSRIRMAQRLTADAYWQKVNEVYTSGQGDVSMAFIKDDLGNWNLKSFSNDPSELLAAYRDATNAAISTAVKLTKKAAIGPAGDVAQKISAASQVANLANQFATGDVAGGAEATVAGANVATLHEQVSTRMKSQRARYLAREKELQDKIDSQQKEIDRLTLEIATPPKNADGTENTEALEKLKTEKGIAETAKTTATDLQAEVRRQALATLNDTLKDHLTVVATMQQVVAPPPPKPLPTAEELKARTPNP